MALTIENQARIIKFKQGDKEIKLKEIEGYSLDQMRKFYAGIYPELTTAILDGPVQSQDGAVYTFKTKIGTKG